MIDWRNAELRKFIILFILLVAWFGFILDAVSPWIQQNFIFAYTIFIIVDSYLMMKYVLELEPMRMKGKFIAFVLIILASDIVMFPYLVSKTGLISTEPQAMMSSDVYIWQLLSNTIPDIAKYFVVYIGVVMIAYILARRLTSKRWFWKNIGNNI